MFNFFKKKQKFSIQKPIVEPILIDDKTYKITYKYAYDDGFSASIANVEKIIMGTNNAKRWCEIISNDSDNFCIEMNEVY